MLEAALHALALLLEPMRLMILVGGVLIGLAIGTLPGLSGVVGLAILIPFTYHLDPHSAFALLLGMAAVNTSSDLIPAVLFGVPGTVGAAATVIDGHAMARRGEAGRAFGAGFTASLLGGLFGAFVLALAIPVLRPVLLAVGSPELLAFAVFGMSMVATLSGRAPLKGLTAAGLGLMIAMIGSSQETGTLRWTFDWLYLWDGLPLVPATLGLFAVPELADMAIARTKIADRGDVNVTLSSQWEGVRDCFRNWWLVIRCSALGVGLGAIPGIGSAVIDWIAYGYAQRTEKNPETFGHGDIRGVISPESSNNAKEGGHLVPTIAFGVPAGASMALLLGAFLIHGLVPGPDMLTKHLDITYSIIWSLTLAHVIGAVICVFGSRWLAKLAEVRAEVLLPIVMSLVFIAAFQGSHGWGDLYSILFFGLLGWIMKRLHWPRPPMILGIVVGGVFERYLFISTELYGAAWLLRPIVIVIMALIAWVLYRPLRQIVANLWHELSGLHKGQFRLRVPAIFTLAVIAVIVAALIVSADWPAKAQLVPRTACYAALIAAALNLLTELFGADKPVATVEKGEAHEHALEPAEALPRPLMLRRAAAFFGWVAAFIGAAALVGFVPAIALFVVAFMRFNFGEPWSRAATLAVCTTLFAYVVFDRGLAVPWPNSVLGDMLPALREATGLV
jgi:putative tricarboxylic transport membrane protein